MPDTSAVSVPNNSNVASMPKLTGRTVALGDMFEIYIDQPIADYASSKYKIFPARGIGGAVGNAFAYVCERSTVPRLQIVEKYLMLQHPSLVRLLARGVITCPDNIERYTFIYDASLGAPIVSDRGRAAAYGMKADLVLNAVLRPLAGALRELHNADMVHGAIFPGNLFDGAVQPLQNVVLGDALSCSYAASVPALYLPSALAAAMPAGRGPGNREDDIYMLGATLAVLLRSHDPLAGKTDEQILLTKMEIGSFSALIENERVPGNVLEMLRGLLQDDHRLRWSIDDVYEWFDGRRAAHRQGIKRLKASRHLVMGTEKILLPSVFAYFAPRQADEVVRLTDNGEIRQWVLRSISDKRLEERIDHAISMATEQGRSHGFQDQLASQLAAACEPDFPVLYRHLHTFPDALGMVLAEIIMAGQDPKPVADLINSQILKFWLNVQHDIPADLNIVIARFEQCQQFLKQRSVGYGLERCLYMLCPDAPCLSPSLRYFYVNTPEDLCRALNIIGDQSDHPEQIIDRHMMSFLSVRDRKIIDPFLPDLGASERHRQISGTIQVLANIQSRAKLPAFPGLTRWLYSQAEPLYERLHDRDLRAQIRKREDSLKNSGMISQLKEALIDHDRLRRDAYEFKAASHEYRLFTYEDQSIDYALKDREQFGIQAGREIAALLAGVVMALAVAGLVLVRINGGPFSW